MLSAEEVKSKIPELVSKKIKFGEPGECWEWTAGRNKAGYGILSSDFFKTTLAHRGLFMLFFGQLPKNICACHTCDNPKCCNPNHLFAGTRQDNNDDRDSKGRRASFTGMNNGRAKISDDMVRLIRMRLSVGEKPCHISRALNVSAWSIYDLKLGKTWKHVV